jgi:Ca2+/Na+ antiporter
MQFFEYHTGSVEVLIKGDLYRVFFPIQPICRYLGSKTKMDFLRTVDRTSAQMKVNELLGKIDDWVDEMEHVETLHRSKFSITPAKVDALRDMSTFIAFVINIVILLWYEYRSVDQDDGSSKVEPKIDTWGRYTIDILGGVQAFISCCMLLGWLITNTSLMNKANWRQYVADNILNESDKKIKQFQERSMLSIKPAKQLPLRECRKILKWEGPTAVEFNIEKKRNFGHLVVLLEYYWISFSYICLNGTFRYFLTYIAISFLGLFLSPIFYSLHLLDVVGRVPTLGNVVKSVSMSKKELSLTAMLGLIIIYIFSTFGFTYFYDMYFDEEVERDINAKKGETT